MLEDTGTRVSARKTLAPASQEENQAAQCTEARRSGTLRAKERRQGRPKDIPAEASFSFYF